MRVRARGAARLVVVLLIAGAGCQTGELDFTTGTPTPSPTPTATGTPTPTPTPASFGNGNGQDGPLVVGTGQIVDAPNTCHSLVSASGDDAEVSVATGLDVGRAVVLHQAQASFANVTDAGPFADGALLNAGRWEIRRITAVNGTALTLDQALAFGYATSAGTSAAQICVIREHTTITVNGTGLIRPAAWDGIRGGLLVLAANGLVTLSAAGGGLSADGRGFRGGPASVDFYSAAQIGFTGETTPDTGLSGERGESADRRARGEHGRGNRGNGGGGGNHVHGGGGGGGGAGPGGFGGMQVESEQGAVPDVRGRGAAAITPTAAERVLFGGGGGGGQTDSAGVPGGAAGGGAVLLFANSLSGTGSISASGNGALNVDEDGPGGGGAGGTILIEVSGDTGTFTGLVRSRGGKGGDQLIDPAGGLGRCGTGGGGGGGRVRANFANGTREIQGGARGVHSNQDPWGSESGADGIVE